MTNSIKVTPAKSKSDQLKEQLTGKYFIENASYGDPKIFRIDSIADTETLRANSTFVCTSKVTQVMGKVPKHDPNRTHFNPQEVFSTAKEAKSFLVESAKQTVATREQELEKARARLGACQALEEVGQ